MKIVVVGAGGVGGYFGALLARSGADVSFVARGAHFEAIQRSGLTIKDNDASFVVSDLRVSQNPAQLCPADLVMICVKLWNIEAVLQQIQPLVGPNTAVVSFQNSVMKDALLESALGPEHVMGGVAYVASKISKPGVITRTGSLKRLIVGEMDGSPSQRVSEFVAACTAAGIDAEASSDVRRATWEKYVFLVGLSATTATTGMSIGPIRRDPRTRQFLLDIMREVVEVARAQGIDFPADYAEQRLGFIDGLAPDMTSSMRHDLEAGNRLESPWLSGGVAAMGKTAGIATPLNRAVADILALHVEGRATPTASTETKGATP